MEILKAIILGIVQGLTEFLPVSSSGHLVILGEILGRELGGEGSTAQSVLLHLGSWLAILIVFRKDILKLVWPRFDFRAFAMLFIASLPAAIVGLTIKKLLPDAQEQWIEANVLQSPWVACCGLIATALVLWLAERKRQLFVRFETAKGVHFWLVGVVGIAQMIAILPGISRSGSTICMVTHDPRYADFAQRKVFMFDGRVVDEDTLHRLRHEEDQRIDAQIRMARAVTP